MSVEENVLHMSACLFGIVIGACGAGTRGVVCIFGGGVV